MFLLRASSLLAVTVLAAVLAGPASAATFGGGATISMVELAPENNSITIAGRDGTYLITDTAVAPTANPGCTATANPNTLSCAATDRTFGAFGTLNTDFVAVTATDLGVNWNHAQGVKLTFTCGSNASCQATGSPGDDTLVGGPSADFFSGGLGNDAIQGMGGNDQLSGNAGNDTIDGGAGIDFLTCDAGNDTVSGGAGIFDQYACATAASGMTITLDGVANDGVAGETDNIAADIEAVIGSRFNDSITGAAGRQQIQGGEGNDTLVGGAGSDLLNGNEGNDILLGEGGDDQLDGEEGADVLSGGAGEDIALYFSRTATLTISLDGKANDGEAGELDSVQGNVEVVQSGDGDDSIRGNALANELYGGGGNDTIIGGAGGDLLIGGPGNDKLAGGTGRDEHLGMSGNDRIFSVDRARDINNCGSGTDVAIGDRTLDTSYATCEVGGR